MLNRKIDLTKNLFIGAVKAQYLYSFPNGNIVAYVDGSNTAYTFDKYGYPIGSNISRLINKPHVTQRSFIVYPSGDTANERVYHDQKLMLNSVRSSHPDAFRVLETSVDGVITKREIL
jgi:hypothetical protein